MIDILCEFSVNTAGKYECTYCSQVVPKAGVRRNCPEKLRQRDHGMFDSSHSIPPPPPSPEPPNLLKRLANFGTAAVNHALKGNPTVSEEVMKERLAICKGCELFKPNGNEAGGVCTHSSCGCNIQDNLNYLNKIAWADQECPIKKWLKSEAVPRDGV